MSESSKENIKTNIFPYDFVKENEVIAVQNGKGIIVSSPKNFNNCLGLSIRLLGQKREPEPPAKIT